MHKFRIALRLSILSIGILMDAITTAVAQTLTLPLNPPIQTSIHGNLYNYTYATDPNLLDPNSSLSPAWFEGFGYYLALGIQVTFAESPVEVCGLNILPCCRSRTEHNRRSLHPAWNLWQTRTKVPTLPWSILSVS